MSPIKHIEETTRPTGSIDFMHGQQIHAWMSEMENRLNKSLEGFVKSERLISQVRGFCRKDAAAYIGVSSSKFDELVQDGRMSKPVRLDGRVIWDRTDLDECFEILKDKQLNHKSNCWFDDDRGEGWS